MDLPAQGSVKEGLEVKDAIRAFSSAWGLGDSEADEIIQGFEEATERVFQYSDIDPYAEEN